MVTNIHTNKFFKILCACLMGNAFISYAFAQQPIFDELGRLIAYPDKIETNCPRQNEKMAVLLVMGQSNVSNSGQKKFVTKYPTKVFNYFNGKCFVASSPLLGTSDDGGELMTPLADNLIDNGAYESVVIVSSAIGGSRIKSWLQGGYLNTMFLSVLSDAASKYTITEVIWHQGEADFFHKTTTEEYVDSFKSLVNTIRTSSTNAPAIYYAIATKCYAGWTPDNPIAIAQRSLANDAANIYLAVDTDSLLLTEDRAVDHCHFSETGELKTANAISIAIRQHRFDTRKQ